ncbi:site-specific integrase [Clostridium estertheticum]|uniref:Site-specific integrase n=1 Tax=Clostridium estertheticum TaxID=238834 RepID=A0AA47EJ75_9CLOT|nr:site-specific integrase [Clostridium estertheticum]MBU3155145.1 site-specific integrase [Clostridium estertheticum]WAG61199.1 site-specific integrase [Clostridium estertheticum]
MEHNITYRQKDKGWQFIISYKDIDNKWKQKSKQGFKTKRDAKPIAEKMLEDLESSIKNNVDVEGANQTFKEVSKMYLKHSNLYKEYNTVKASENTFSKFKCLNSIKIKDIQKIDIQGVVDKLVKEGLKQSTITSHVVRLNTFLKYVKEDLNIIVSLPTEKIKVPKEKNKTNKKALTKPELDKLLNDLINNKFYIVAFIAANTGIRLGEILGLTWNDLDEINLTLDVNKQWKVLEKNKPSTFGTLKSKNSYRTVPISSKTLNALKFYKKNNPTDFKNRIAPFNSASIFKYLNPKLRELADISLHELRHTYATLLIADGMDFKTAAKLLGHDVQETYRTYSHVTSDMLKNAAKRIDKIFK